MRSYAHASLTETLDVMNARIVKVACIGLQVHADQWGPLGIALNPDLSRPIAFALATFAMRFVCYLAAPRFRPWESSNPIGLLSTSIGFLRDRLARALHAVRAVVHAAFGQRTLRTVIR